VKVKFNVSRRALLVGVGTSSAASVVALSGCGAAPETCSDPNQLTDAQASIRRSMNYVEASGDAARRCQQCRYFEASSAGACGTCSFLGGAVNSAGHCDGWAEHA
jgi:hypothetical protein